MEPLIQLSGLSAGYSDRMVISDLNASIGRGEIWMLIGPNGGGKSTILKTLSGQIPPLSGNIQIDGKELSSMHGKERARRIAVVTTERIRTERMTCRDVVLAGRHPHTDGFGLFREQDYSAVRDAMERLQVLELAERDFNAVSDGQKQRVLIARAVAQEPEILLMDEPTSYLDIRYRMELMRVIRELAGSGVTILASLHEVDLAVRNADHLLCVFENGRARDVSPETCMKEHMLRDLFSLENGMYMELFEDLGRTVLGKADSKDGAYGYANRACRFFPCHTMDPECFSCLFCYCPLYGLEDCGGEFTRNADGIKNCTECTYVHDRRNYGEIIRKIREKVLYRGEKT